MTFYESIALQGMRALAVRMFIETLGKCAVYFDQEARCVTGTSQLFGEEEAVLVLHFAPNLRFTLRVHFAPGLQSAVYVLH